jgi:hypothetical protein
MKKLKYTISQLENEVHVKKYQVMNKFGKAPWLNLPISVLDDVVFHKTITDVVHKSKPVNDKVINLITIIQ